MAREKTYANGGVVLASDLNTFEDDYETAFASYRDLVHVPGGNILPGSSASAIYLLGSPSGVPVSLLFGDAFYIDPADLVSSGRTARLRLRASVITNNIGPGTSFTFGLYGVSTFAGASGVAPTVSAISAVIAGSTVVVPTPAPSSMVSVNGADFTFPSAGYYALGAVPAATTTSLGATWLRGHLQQRLT